MHLMKSCDPSITGKHDLPSDTHIIDMQGPEATEGINLREEHSWSKNRHCHNRIKARSHTGLTFSVGKARRRGSE